MVENKDALLRLMIISFITQHCRPICSDINLCHAHALLCRSTICCHCYVPLPVIALSLSLSLSVPCLPPSSACGAPEWNRHSGGEEEGGDKRGREDRDKEHSTAHGAQPADTAQVVRRFFFPFLLLLFFSPKQVVVPMHV